jgi:hypothetical protein
MVDEITLYCNNPQCGRPIQQGPISYDKERLEIYHPGTCSMLANAHRCIKSGNPEFMQVDKISLDEALDLFRKGELSQASGLEGKAESS